jgi:hypothetical protein
MIARSLLSQTAEQNIKIFYSYARRDESWRKDFDRLLSEFEWDIAVRTWYDGEVEPGTEWKSEIDKNIGAADVILLFVGQAFVDSSYCREVELPAALSRHVRGEARVVPIILEETIPDWRTLDFAHMQVLPQNGIPVSATSDRTRALEGVVQSLVDIIVHQGLHPETRMRWELHLEGELDGFTHTNRLAVTTELRQSTGDQTLRCVGVGGGSVVLTMESTQDAMTWAMRSFEEEVERVVAGYRIIKLVRLFGAGVRAISHIPGADRPASLPKPELMLLPSPNFIPVLPKMLLIDVANPLNFQFKMDTGNSGLKANELEVEIQKLFDYFLTEIAVSEEDTWVNLAPNENAKLLSEPLSGTRFGAALLEFDYRLKRLASSLMHPDLEIGRQFWNTVIERCSAELGTADVPLTSFQRVWVVPSEAVLWEGTVEAAERVKLCLPEPYQSLASERPCVLLVKHRFTAMTEQEYLAGSGKASPGRTEQGGRAAMICHQAFREIVLPIIDTEVNDGKNFAELRQLYTIMIFGTWFKLRYKDHPKVSRFIDSGRPDQLAETSVKISDWEFGQEGRTKIDFPAARSPTSENPTELGATPGVDHIRASASYNLPENREYFERYLEIFKSGVFYVEREELVPGTKRKRARAYLSGGIDLRKIDRVLKYRAT